MEIFITKATDRCLWMQTVPLHELGRLEIQTASTIEFNPARRECEVRMASDPDTVSISHSSNLPIVVDARPYRPQRFHPPRARGEIGRAHV